MIYAMSGEYKTQQKNHIYTLRQNHSSGIRNCRLDYLFVSNKLQEFANETDIIPAFKTNLSSVLVTITNYNFFLNNKAQAFGNSLTH